MQENHRPFAILAFTLFAALLLRAIPVFFGIESTDIRLYREQAEILASGQSLYAFPRNIFPYAPLSLFYPLLCLKLSQALNLPFHLIPKFFAILSDTVIVGLVYLVARKRFGRRKAMASAALYAVNPVTLLIASFQGNIMPFTALLMIAAYFFQIEGQRTRSALCLGLAVAWRSFPALLLPYFALRERSKVERMHFTGVALLPFALCFIPFVSETGAVLGRMITYSGGGVYEGPFAALFALLILKAPVAFVQNLWRMDTIYVLAKGLFLFFYVWLLRKRRAESLAENIVSVFFLFYVLYPGVAPQYLAWAVPFLLVIPGRAAFFAYSISGAYAIVTSYWVYFKDILFGNIAAPPLALDALMWHAAAAQVLFSISCLVFLFPRPFFRIRRPSGPC